VSASNEIAIHPLSHPIAASIRVPGSKSITNRALLMAAMAPGQSTLEGIGVNDDTRRMAAALGALGFDIALDEVSMRAVVEGKGGAIPVPGAELDTGGAGTAMRFIAGFVTLGRGRFRLDGNQRMRERPVGPLLDAMAQMGIEARSERGNRCPPITIDMGAGCFEGGAARIDAAISSQFVSALLMPAPLWPRGLELEIAGEAARPFIEMTLKLMRRWGVESRTDASGNRVTIPGGQAYATQSRFEIEPDASGASYFAAAAALCGGNVTIPGLKADSVQGDIGFIGLLERMGARVEWRLDGVTIRGTGRLTGLDVAMNTMPDVVPTLAAIAPLCESPTRIRAVGFVRHHESDRIHALATELRRLGAAVDEFDDGLLIQPCEKLRPALIETYDDHRIAMAFAVTGLKSEGIRINNPGCVAKTYPDFFRDLESLRADRP